MARRRRRSATFKAAKSPPLAWRMVSMSSRPCVGCALRPSPALTSAVPASADWASTATAPSTWWRTTKPRTPIASMLRSVSIAVSPLLVDEVDASKLSTSAPRRVAASWKLERVRVDGSKNSVHTALPASDVARLRRRAPARAVAARDRAGARSTSRGSPSRVSRWRRRPWSSICLRSCRTRSLVHWRCRPAAPPASARR